MIDRVLNMPLDYLRCFTVVLREIPGSTDIYQTGYIQHSLQIFPYSEVMYRSTTFKLIKDKQRLKQDNHQFNLMFLFFHFLHSNVSDNKCHKQKWHMLFFTHIKLVVCVLARVHAITCIKQRRLVMIIVTGGFPKKSFFLLILFLFPRNSFEQS